MKKEYVKPYLALESFQLVAALAGSCSGDGQIPLNQSISGCNAWDDYDDPLFGSGCQHNAEANPKLCYQNSLDGGMYLTS